MAKIFADICQIVMSVGQFDFCPVSTLGTLRLSGHSLLVAKKVSSGALHALFLLWGQIKALLPSLDWPFNSPVDADNVAL